MAGYKNGVFEMDENQYNKRLPHLEELKEKYPKSFQLAQRMDARRKKQHPLNNFDRNIIKNYLMYVYILDMITNQKLSSFSQEVLKLFIENINENKLMSDDSKSYAIQEINEAIKEILRNKKGGKRKTKSKKSKFKKSMRKH
jgi:hypothetical protein